MLSLHGPNINLFIERGPKLGPVLEVMVENVAASEQRLAEAGCIIVKDGARGAALLYAGPVRAHL